MRTLLLLRHAKSAHGDQWTNDIDRPLNERGQDDAPVMGQLLKRSGIVPDLTLCSPAKRTRETADLFLNAAGKNLKVEFVDDLYGASVGQLREIVSEQSAQTLLVISHNPGLQFFAGSLIGGADIEYPTCALACIDFDSRPWTEALDSGGRLRWFAIPRLIQKL